MAEPNDWEKRVRAVTQAEGLSSKQELYLKFWTRWLERLHADRPQWSRSTRPPHSSWFTMTAGVLGITYYTSFTRQGLSSELDFESPEADINSARFEKLQAHRLELDDAYGGVLDWQEMQGRKATRVAEYLPDADVTNELEWGSYLEWLLDRQTRLRDAVAALGGLAELLND